MTWIEWVLSRDCERLLEITIPLLLLGAMGTVMASVAFLYSVALIGDGLRLLFPKSPKGKWVKHRITGVHGICLCRYDPFSSTWRVEVACGSGTSTMSWHRNEFEICGDCKPE